MALFDYRGRGPDGSVISGQLEGTSASAIASALMARNISPTQIKEARTNESRLASLERWWRMRPVAIEEHIIFCRQMHSLTRAGVPLVRSIETLAASSRSEKLQADLRDVVTMLQSGQDLTTCLGQHPETFSQLFVNMVHVGENTGRLEEAFLELAGHMERERETRKRITQATRYPMFVLIAITIAILVINFLVIPKFAGVFAKLHTELPLPTRMLMASSSFMTHYAVPLALLAGGALFLWLRHIRTPEGKYTWDRFKLRLPIVGPIFERIMLSRFSRSFAMMMRSGVPIIQSLKIVARAVDNEYIGRAILGMSEHIERGDTITRTATATGMFSPLVLQMLMVGEESGTLEEMLSEVADFYDEEVEYDLKQLTDAIEPILIIGIGFIVLILALGVFLPLWELNGAMHR